jgi:histidine kinase
VLIYINEYSNIREIHRGTHSITYSGIQSKTGTPVIIKYFPFDWLDPSQIVQLTYEYEQYQLIESDYVAKIYGCEKVRDEQWNGLIYYIEDPPGLPLKQYLVRKKIHTREFLDIAIQITEGLKELHRNEIIHSDINPNAIMVNPDKRNVKIKDIGFNAVATYKTEDIYDSDFVLNNLPYISPEQTGRTSKTIDYRSDFYSLGMTLYEVLTSVPAFPNSDPMEIIHGHIARQPLPPADLNRNMPQMISDLVMKLISKNPQDRYQSTHGILSDMKECLSQLIKTGTIEPFFLGRNDIHDKFVIPEKIYGRTREIGAVSSEFEQACTGKSRLVLITGCAGIGKSTLIHELHKPVTQHRGYHAAGKFHRLNRDIPYSALIHAFQGLIKRILSESEEKVQAWRASLLEAVGQNGGIITNIIPEAEILIGPQPEIQYMDPEKSQNRFIFVLKNFINIFARKEHPLAVIMEDIEWADTASLKLLLSLITDTGLSHILFVCTCRDDAIADSPVLASWLGDIKNENIQNTEIALRPISPPDLTELLIDTLNCTSETCAGLAEIMYQKTGGNPFFIKQFLKRLYEDELLAYSSSSGWSWDIGQIQNIQATDNIIESTIEHIARLNQETLAILKIAAIIGSRFNPEALSGISSLPMLEVINILNESIRNGLLVHSPPGYSFSHDRIHEAILSITPEAEQKKLHRLSGDYILKQASRGDLYEWIFVIVDHFNQCPELIADDEKISIARLNLLASKKAKLSAAYVSSVNYLKSAVALLPDNVWKTDYDLAFSTYYELAEAEYLADRLPINEKAFSDLLAKSRNRNDMIKIYSLLVDLRTHQNRPDEAIQVGLEACKIYKLISPIALSLPFIMLKFIRIRKLLKKKKTVVFFGLPDIKDRDHIQLMNLLVKITVPAYYSENKRHLRLLFIIILNLVDITLKKGNSKYAPYAYSIYGAMLGLWFNDHRNAYKFGKLGIDLKEKFNDVELEAKIFNLFALIAFWNRPFHEYIEYFSTALQSGMTLGDFHFTNMAISNIFLHSIRKGKDINSLILIYETHINFVRLTRSAHFLMLMKLFYRMLVKLKGTTPYRPEYESGDAEEIELKKAAENDRKFLCLYNLTKMVTAYIFLDYEQALRLASRIHAYIDRSLFGLIHVTEYSFYLSLSISAGYDRLSRSEKKRRVAIFKKCENSFKKWSSNCPENFLHQFLLLRAERSRIEGRDREALQYYGQAIHHSRKNGYINHEAIICERTAEFFIQRENPISAKAHLVQARNCYREWGAEAKCAELEQRYPNLLQEVKPAETGVMQQYLNYTTIVSSLQAISSEIIMDDLLKSLMKIAIENAGADRGYFITVEGNDCMVAAEIMSEGEITTIIRTTPLAAKKDIMVPVINYVMNLKKYLVLHDARLEEDIPLDDYLVDNRPLSVLCLPVIRHLELIGILYLENRAIAGAFTADHIGILELIASQAAISLEIARLYDKLKQEIAQHWEVESALRESEDRYRMLVESMNEGICVLDDSEMIGFINSRFCEILGYDREEIIGGRLENFISEASRPIMKEQLMKRRRGDNVPYEIELVNRNGGIIPTVVSPRPIFDSSGSFKGSFGLFTDITDKKKMEEDLLKSTKIESLGVFAGGIAHDFNNLLTAIIGNISLAKMSLPGKNEMYAILDDAENASIRAKDLTQQLLTFSRGGAPIKKTISIKNFLRKTIDFALSGSNIICIYTIQNDLWNAEIDEGQITQVIHNLVINAMQSMLSGGVIEVFAKNETVDSRSRLPLVPGNYIKIEITDHGSGIPAENQKLIFDPYFTTKQNGSGLGLTVSYSIIRRHDGLITFESEPGKGTRFFVYLPSSREQVHTEETMEQNNVVPAARVLIMDDDELVLRVAGNMLSHLGVSADYATHGEEAIAMYMTSVQEGHPYDLIIMDLTIPGKMGGKEVIVRLKEINPDIKAIVSSGYSNDPVMANYAEYGFCGVVAKPYRMEDLQAAINSVLG